MKNFFKHYKRDEIHNPPAISALLVAFVLVMSAIPREITIYSFDDIYTRQYGHSITIPYAIICVLLLPLIKRGIFRINIYAKKSPFLIYLIYGAFSVVFVLFNQANLAFYFVAAFKYILYIITFLILASTVSLRHYIQGLDMGFKIALFIQTLIGWLYEFAGITIPYLGKYSFSYRNGLSRMQGTFTHPGDFSLYAGIMFVYFFYKLLSKNEIETFIYAVVAYIDVFLSGARTMLLTVSILIAITLFYKYRSFLWVKMLLVIIIIGAIYWFLNSKIFVDMFIEHSFKEMFLARYIHWIIGFKIMLSNIGNFIFGVGLNNHVKYIDDNYGMFAVLVSSAGEALDSEFVRGMPIHNSFLIVGSELGIIGLLLYIAFYVYHIRGVINVAKILPKYFSICRFLVTTLFLVLIYSIQGWAAMKSFAWNIVIIMLALSSIIVKQAHSEKGQGINN